MSHDRIYNHGERGREDKCETTYKIKMSRVKAEKIAALTTKPDYRMSAYKCRYCKRHHVGRWLDVETLKKIHETHSRPPKRYEVGDDWRVFG